MYYVNVVCIFGIFYVSFNFRCSYSYCYCCSYPFLETFFHHFPFFFSIFYCDCFWFHNFCFIDLMAITIALHQLALVDVWVYTLILWEKTLSLGDAMELMKVVNYIRHRLMTFWMILVNFFDFLNRTYF